MRINFVNTMAYLCVGLFVYLIVTKFTDNPAIFINPEGLTVVCGGIVAAAMASFPWIVLKDAIASAWRALTQATYIPVDEAREIVRLATLGQRGLTRLESELERIENEYMKTGLELMLDGVTPRAFLGVMQKRVSEYQERCARGVNVFLTMSKFAPALGLAATVLGLVQLLSKLGAADMTELGNGMAVALSGTFYGIIFSNLFLQPLAELLQMKTESEIKTREMILEGLHSILERQEPLIIGELVNSFLPDPKRIDFAEEMQEITAASAASAPAAGTTGAAA